MKNDNYKPRLIDKKFQEYLETFGAVCVEGPKWCGKTWSSERQAKSVFYLASPENNFGNRMLARLTPEEVLDGEMPRLLDEWQEVPELWDAVRFMVDRRKGETGQFILTGSATPVRKGILHSGAGRIGRLRMHPMSLLESGDSTGKISLENLCHNRLKPVKVPKITLEHLAELIIRGGWPGVLDKPLKSAMRLNEQYIRAVLDEDIQKLDKVKRNKHKIELLLRSLARNESSLATNRTLKNDIKEVDNEDVDVETVAAYLDIFARLFITANQKPYSTRLRSSVRVRQGEKHHFADPSLAAALLGTTPQQLMKDLETFGLLFEALAERDLGIYADYFDGDLYHYRDYQDKEIDAIVTHPDGAWLAAEIKLGFAQAEEAAKNLLAMRDAIVSEGKEPPTALAVIVGLGEMAFTLENGVHVVPLTALGV